MASSAAQWYLRVPEGNVYGPVNKMTLDQWVREGRADQECEVGHSPQGPWEPIVNYYPFLQAAPAPAPKAVPVPPQVPPDSPSFSQPPALPQAASVAVRPMPGKLQAVRIMAIIGGGLGLFYGALYLVSSVFSIGLTLPCAAYQIVMGSVALVQGIQAPQRPPRTAAIMQIVAIICLDVVNFILGLIEIQFINDPDLKAYYATRGISY